MKRKNLIILILFLFSIGIELAFSQKVELRVVFPVDIDYNKLSIYYNNGKVSKDIKPTIVNHEWILTDSLYDPFSLIVFYYKNDPKAKVVEGHSFWFSDKPAEIIFHGDSLYDKGPLEYCTLRNVLSSDDACKDMIDSSLRKATAEFDDYFMQNYDSIHVNPLMMDTFVNKRNKVVESRLERVRTQSKNYFVLDYFDSSIVKMRSKLTSYELLLFFNENFPDSLKNTYKGKQIAQTLKNRISSKKGGEAPDFNTKSIHGNEVSLSALKGKYIILDFWASWCAPCIKFAVPKLKEIRQKYSSDKLEIVSVTLDEDYGKYQNALKKLETNFIDVFDGKKIVEDYAVGPIPQIILIHPDGTILYNREEENDADLTKLEHLLVNILH